MAQSKWLKFCEEYAMVQAVECFGQIKEYQKR